MSAARQPHASRALIARDTDQEDHCVDRWCILEADSSWARTLVCEGDMHSDCLFCRLIQGGLSSHQAYKDAVVAVILPRQPVNPGHAMVVTKIHMENFYDADDDLYTHLMLVVKRTALAIKAVFAPLQVVSETSGIGNRHVHVHVIPVHGFYDLVPKEVMEKQDAQPPASDEQLASVAQDLRRYLTTHV